MTAGKAARLERIGTAGKHLVVPMDHGITLGAVTGLVDIESTIDAGYIVHLNASTTLGPDEKDKRPSSTVEDAIRAGADAVSFHINVGSEYEPEQITQLGELTSEAAAYGMPVLAMAYARGHDVRDRSDPEGFAEDLGHAVRLGEELGADVIKTSYSGDPETFERVVESTRLPVVIAGGSRGTDQETLSMVRGAVDAGAAGVSMGRSIFQHETPEAITEAIAAVIHDGAGATEAAERAGLSAEARSG